MDRRGQPAWVRVVSARSFASTANGMQCARDRFCPRLSSATEGTTTATVELTKAAMGVLIKANRVRQGIGSNNGPFDNYKPNINMNQGGTCLRF